MADQLTHDESTPGEPKHGGSAPKTRKPLFLFITGFLVLFLLVVLVGWLPRHSRDADIEARAKAQTDAVPIVDVTVVQPPKPGAPLIVPGTTIPMTEAYVYARASGYLKKRFVDIGDKVQQGQLLAIIDAPDLDQQVDQAREQLRQSEQQLEQQKAQLTLATATVQRYRVLVQKGVFSRQDGDQQEANYASQVANVAGAQRNVEAFKANLNHVMTLQSYENVRAPFAGVITQRNVDVGALISAGGANNGASGGPAPQGQTSTNGGSQQGGQSNNAGVSGNTSSASTPAQSPGQGGPLFGIAQVRQLRVLVSVPEAYAAVILPGDAAQLSFPSIPGVTVPGKISRTSDSIDPNTRTLLTEVQVDNANGKLMSGMSTVVTFPPKPGFTAPLTITGDAIALRKEKSVVAIVKDNKIHIVPITIGRDFGTSLEVLTGIKPGDLLVTDVTDDVVDGATVQVHSQKPVSGSGN